MHDDPTLLRYATHGRDGVPPFGDVERERNGVVRVAAGPIPHGAVGDDPSAMAYNNQYYANQGFNSAVTAADSSAGKLVVDLDALEQLKQGLANLLSDYFEGSGSPGPAGTFSKGLVVTDAHVNGGTAFDEATVLMNAYNNAQSAVLQLYQEVSQQLASMQQGIDKIHNTYTQVENDTHSYVKTTINGSDVTITGTSRGTSTLGVTTVNTVTTTTSSAPGTVQSGTTPATGTTPGSNSGGSNTGGYGGN